MYKSYYTFYFTWHILWFFSGDYMYRRDLHKMTGFCFLFMCFARARRYEYESEQIQNFLNTDENGNLFTETN